MGKTWVMRSYETGPKPRQEAPRVAIAHASERVTLACRALSAAAEELRLVYERTGITPVDDAADMVAAETEKVCEMAEEIAKLAANIGRRTLATTGSPD